MTPHFRCLAREKLSFCGMFLFQIFQGNVSGAVLDLTQVAVKTEKIPGFWDVSL